MAGTLKAQITATTTGLMGTGGDEASISFSSSVSVDGPVVITGATSNLKTIYTSIPTHATKITYLYVRNTGVTVTNDLVTIKLGGAAVMTLGYDQWAFIPVAPTVSMAIGNAASGGALLALADYAYFTEV
tara:strand:+ start:424 stop:813 length:390 start_codon:yes stop_codon:yes gene_type:complete